MPYSPVEVDEQDYGKTNLHLPFTEEDVTNLNWQIGNGSEQSGIFSFSLTFT
jgi:hypothetical protein